MESRDHLPRPRLSKAALETLEAERRPGESMAACLNRVVESAGRATDDVKEALAAIEAALRDLHEGQRRIEQQIACDQSGHSVPSRRAGGGPLDWADRIADALGEEG